MELRHLRYSVAVAEELSFRKAARRLSVSEPAVTVDNFIKILAVSLPRPYRARNSG